LLDRVRQRNCAAEEVVFRSGDPGDALYIVAHGQVEVVNDTTGYTLAELGPGQAFGEMALLTGGTRTATVCCTADSHLLVIDKADFDRLLADDPVPQRSGAQAQPRARPVEPARG
jgi:CRP-like cAMP-binding protein